MFRNICGKIMVKIHTNVHFAKGYIMTALLTIILEECYDNFFQLSFWIFCCYSFIVLHDFCRELIIQFNLEAGYLCHTFYEYKRAKEHFNTALKISGLTLEFTGIHYLAMINIAFQRWQFDMYIHNQIIW